MPRSMEVPISHKVVDTASMASEQHTCILSHRLDTILNIYNYDSVCFNDRIEFSWPRSQQQQWTQQLKAMTSVIVSWRAK